MISVVISTYNRGEWLANSLGALACQDFAKAKYEVLVVNNNCSDNTSEVVSHAAQAGLRVRELHESQQGLSPARNLGAREACGEVLAFLDDDAIPHVGWLKSIEDAFNKISDLSLLGGAVTPRFEGPPVPTWLCGEVLLGFFALRTTPAPGLTLVHDLQHLPYGCNFVVRRSVFLALGGFNQHLGRNGTQQLGGEDTEFALRVRFAGGKIALSSHVAVEHWNPERKTTLDYILANAASFGQSILPALRYMSPFELEHFVQEAELGLKSAIPVAPSVLTQEVAENIVYATRRRALAEHIERIKALKARPHLLWGGAADFAQDRVSLDVAADSIDYGLVSLHRNLDWQIGNLMTQAIGERECIKGKTIVDLAPAHGGMLVAAALAGAGHLIALVKSEKEKQLLQEAIAELKLDTTILLIKADNDGQRLYREIAQYDPDIIVARKVLSTLEVAEALKMQAAAGINAIFYSLVSNPLGSLTRALAKYHGVAKPAPSWLVSGLAEARPELVAQDALEAKLRSWARAGVTFPQFSKQLEAFNYSAVEMGATDLDMVELAPLVNVLEQFGWNAKTCDGTEFSGFFKSLAGVEVSLPGSYVRNNFCRDYIAPYWWARLQCEAVLAPSSGVKAINDSPSIN